MSELTELYQEVILDHNKNPRNFGRPEGPCQEAKGVNPLCGDKVTVYVVLKGKKVAAVHFEGSGCAISKAAASTMTEMVKGKTVAQVEKIFKAFHELVTGKGESSRPAVELGKLKVFAGVSEFPMRVKCATLSWHTLRAALGGAAAPVSTE